MWLLQAANFGFIVRLMYFRMPAVDSSDWKLEAWQSWEILRVVLCFEGIICVGALDLFGSASSQTPDTAMVLPEEAVSSQSSKNTKDFQFDVRCRIATSLEQWGSKNVSANLLLFENLSVFAEKDSSSLNIQASSHRFEGPEPQGLIIPRSPQAQLSVLLHQELLERLEFWRICCTPLDLTQSHPQKDTKTTQKVLL